jgi:peptidoglycan/LPS O-acetylase OafA/YrhL
MNKGKFFPEIEGLRALAIIPVILCHLDFKAAAGGFIGVDVFFVISGFLITRILYRGFQDNTFSFLSFVERRARRLLPALAVMMLTTIVCGYLILPPTWYERLTHSALSQILLSSNYYFYLGSGYWDIGARQKPLLHTWSLSLEEQFYLGMILVMFLLQKFNYLNKKAFISALLLGGVVSFSIAEWRVLDRPSETFFLMPARMWEFLVGSMLVFTSGITNKKLNTSMAAIGVLGILTAVVVFDRDTTFPGLSALVPTLGTALFIYSVLNSENQVGAIFSLAPIRRIGALSYSLYLWHWPIWVYLQKVDLFDHGVGLKAVALAATFVISVVSYTCVETPIRLRRFLPSSRSFLIFMVAIQLIVFLTPMVHEAKLQYFKYTDPDGYKFLIGQMDRDPRYEECHDRTISDMNQQTLCRIGDQSETPKILVWGDSFAAFSIPGINQALGENNLSAEQLTRGGCQPVFGEYLEETRQTSGACTEVRHAVKKYIEDQKFDYIIMMAHWHHYLHAVDWNGANFSDAVRSTISDINRMGTEVILIENPPEYNFDIPIPDMLYSNYKNSGNVNIEGMTKEEYQVQFDGYSEIYTAFDGGSNHFLRTEDIFCPEGRCLLQEGGYSLYIGNSHLTARGALLLADKLSRVLQDAVEDDYVP